MNLAKVIINSILFCAAIFGLFLIWLAFYLLTLSFWQIVGSLVLLIQGVAIIKNAHDKYIQSTNEIKEEPIGFCKECGEEVYQSDYSRYTQIYECHKCGYFSKVEELLNP